MLRNERCRSRPCYFLAMSQNRRPRGTPSSKGGQFAPTPNPTEQSVEALSLEAPGIGASAFEKTMFTGLSLDTLEPLQSLLNGRYRQVCSEPKSIESASEREALEGILRQITAEMDTFVD